MLYQEGPFGARWLSTLQSRCRLAIEYLMDESNKYASSIQHNWAVQATGLTGACVSS
jgi:hypothetical protein